MMIAPTACDLASVACSVCHDDEQTVAHEFSPYKVVRRRSCDLHYPSPRVIPEHVAFYNRNTPSSLMTKAGLTRVTAVSYMRAYSAHLVVEELNLWPAVMKRLGRRNLVFPGYMVALCGMHASSTG
jgi:hypothetical protein